MPLSLKSSLIFRWLFKLFKYTSILLLTVILIVCLILVLLPTAVSTDWSHGFIQENISKALDRPVRIEKIYWSWSNGIIINRLAIPDSPDFSDKQLIALEHVTLKLNLKRLLHRELNLEFLLSDLDVNVIKISNGKLNIQTFGKKDIKSDKPPAPSSQQETSDDEEQPDGKPNAKPSPKKEKKPFVLPIEVSAQIRFNGINLLYDDRGKAEKYSVKDLEISLEVPSVKTLPINLAIGLDILAKDQVIPRSFLNASLSNLFDTQGALNIDGIIATLDANLPGIIADVRADMKASEIKSNIQIDLASVMKVAVPLIPKFPSPTQITGKIILTAASGTRPEDPLAFDATLAGSNLSVSGKVINGKSVGPGNISVHLNGVVDLQAEKLDLETGEIRILENSYIKATARLDQFKQDIKEIHLAVSPMYLDLNEIIAFAGPFIPPTVQLDNQGKQSKISLNAINFDGLLPTGQAKVLLDQLECNLPKIILMDKTGKDPILQVAGTRINLEKVTAQLNDLFPAAADLSLSIAVDTLINSKAPKTINVSGIHLDQLNVHAMNLQKSEISKFKIAGKISMDNQLHIEQIHLPDLVKVNDLTQSLKMNASLCADENMIASIDHLDVTGKNISILKEGIGPIDTSMDIHLALEEVFLKNLAPVNADIKNFMASLTIDDAVDATLTANAKDTANTSFNADLKINSDINTLTQIIPPKFLPGITGSGNLNIALNAEGRRPKDKEMNSLKKKQLADNLSFIDQFNFNVKLDNGSVEIAKTGREPIRVDSISASPLLSYNFLGKAGKGNIASLITTGSVEGLPGIKSDTPVSTEFSFSGTHDYASFIDLNQSLTVAPAGIKESIHITIDGLERMITQTPLPKIPVWLSKVGAKLNADIQLPDCSALKELGLPGLSEIDLDGLIDAGVSFNLIPGQSTDGSFSLNVKDLNFTRPKTISVENVDANIDFSKSYLIQSAKQLQAASARSGLSSNIFESAGQPFLFTQDSDIYRHIRLLHERMNPKPALSFQKLDVLAAPFPLIIDESMVMLNLDNGLPNLDHFQFNLLGGTINGSIALLNKNTDEAIFEPNRKFDQFNVSTALTFSGINTAQIFPRAFSKDDYSKANISGAMYADIPVTDQLQTLLQNMALTVEFTRIGSRALERMLYALDPYESNEAIVSQRLLLKTGSPKKIRLDIKDGFMSLRGKVSVKGFEISLPAIRRLNIAMIPGMDKFEDRLSGLLPLIGILQKISAEHIVIDKQANMVTFK